MIYRIERLLYEYPQRMLIVGIGSFAICIFSLYLILVRPEASYRIEQLNQIIFNSMRIDSSLISKEKSNEWKDIVIRRTYYVPAGIENAQNRIIQNLLDHGWKKGIPNRAIKGKTMQVDDNSLVFHNEYFIIQVRQITENTLELTGSNYVTFF